jgi:hypothetical protein
MACSCTLTIALLLGWAWRNRVWLQEPILQQPYLESGALSELRVWQGRSRTVPGGVVLGNSLTECRGSTVGDVATGRLAARNTPHTVVTVWGGAFGPVQYYYLLDDVLAGRPEVVIIEVDQIRLVSTRITPGLLYLALSRKLSFDQALRIRTALASEGVTLFDPFLYRLEERRDVSYLVPGVQERWREVLTRWGDAVNTTAGVRTTSFDLRGLYLMSAESTRTIGRLDPNDSPLVPVLREIGARLRRAGVTVLFYVSPMNEAILGPQLSANQARQRLNRLRVAVGAAPEEWVDLHDALPSDAFRDWQGHMQPVGCERVGEKLADAVLTRRPSR